MELSYEYLYKKTREYTPGWCFNYINNYGSKNHARKEEVRVLEAYPHHILVTNGKYNYSINRYDLFIQKRAKELANEQEG